MNSGLKALAADFERALLTLNKRQASTIIHTAIEKWDLQTVIVELIVQPLTHIGEGWKEGTLSLSQVYMSGRICEDLIDVLLPASSLERRDQPKVAIAVLHDFHALGKRIIYASLRASGMELLDFGHGLDVETLTQKVIKNNIDILFISVLMYPSALKVKELTKRLESRNTRIMVGGAPFMFNADLYKQVGADATGVGVADAIDFINNYTRKH